ncbi:hypothetical protein ECIV_ORF58 [European chub iridovirus]|nr:hypothetical protein ECIV_ORF58 [European chub iridovirus]
MPLLAEQLQYTFQKFIMKLDIAYFIIHRLITSILDHVPHLTPPQAQAEVVVPTNVPMYLHELHYALDVHLKSLYKTSRDNFLTDKRELVDEKWNLLELRIFNALDTLYTDRDISALYFTIFDTHEKDLFKTQIRQEFTQLIHKMTNYFNDFDNKYKALEMRAAQQIELFKQLEAKVGSDELIELRDNINQLIDRMTEFNPWASVIDKTQLDEYFENGFDGKTFREIVKESKLYPLIKHFTFTGTESESIVLPDDCKFVRFKGSVAQASPAYDTMSGVYTNVYGLSKKTLNIISLQFPGNKITTQDFVTGYIPVDPNYKTIRLKVTSTFNLTFEKITCSVVIIF